VEVRLNTHGRNSLATKVFFSDESGFAVASVIVTGKTDAVLIDAQWTLSNAHRVIAEILETGKYLKTIYITHAHPDHYFGLGTIAEAFPEARLVALPSVARVINISSVAGISGVPRESPYAASKWGVIGFTETLAIEVGKFGIRVNCISPGATRTQEFEDWVRVSAADAGVSYEEMMSKITDNNALNRIAEPFEIAACVVFLASDDSSAMTGHNLVAICGFHLIHPNMIH
jgi:NAD(P)-dependent dehydrogenase (short-subunit alcohol dehydrogenase family)